MPDQSPEPDANIPAFHDAMNDPLLIEYTKTIMALTRKNSGN